MDETYTVPCKLTELRKENAIENYRNNMNFSWADEAINTINMISKAIHCDYDYYSYYQLNNYDSFTHYGYAMALYDKEQNLFQIICIIND